MSSNRLRSRPLVLDFHQDSLLDHLANLSNFLYSPFWMGHPCTLFSILFSTLFFHGFKELLLIFLYILLSQLEPKLFFKLSSQQSFILLPIFYPLSIINLFSYYYPISKLPLFPPFPSFHFFLLWKRSTPLWFRVWVVGANKWILQFAGWNYWAFWIN